MIASGLALYLLSNVLTRSSLFVVKRVEVEASGRPGAEEVRRVSGVRPGQSLLTLDAAEVTRRLEAHPWIRHATVVKRLPDGVLLKVLEARPAALVGVKGRLHYMDGEGKVLGKIAPGAPLDFPMITGLEQEVEAAHHTGMGRDVQQALSLLRALEAAPVLGSVSEIHVDRSEGLRFVLEGFPVPVQVGWKGFSKKMIGFEKAFPSLASQSNAIESVDLRFSGQVVVRQREGSKLRVPGGDRTEALAGSDISFPPTT
jgi:cell division protein FtsQ